MQAMLLAAGFGTRLRPYSLQRPKPLFPILNRPLLLVLLDMLRQAGCGRTVVNGHHLGHLIEKAVTPLPEVLFQFEPEILGTGGSLRQALPHFADEPLLVMNGDICHDISIERLWRHHKQSGNSITMALHNFPRFNTVLTRDDAILGFRPVSKNPAGPFLAYTGIQVVNPDIIERIPSGCFYHIIDLYEQLLREGMHIGFMRVDGCLWRDIGTPEDYLLLHKELLTGSFSHSLPLAEPSGQWLVSAEAVVHETAGLEGWGCIGAAEIDRDVLLRNCVVWDNALVPAGLHLADMIIP